MKLFSSALVPLGIGAMTLLWTLNLRAQPEVAPATEAPEIGQPATPRVDAFSPIVRLMADNQLAEAAAQLKLLKANGLKPDQVTRWQTLAARAALRLGDTNWLAQINEDGALSTGADELVTLSALRLLSANRLDETRSTLAGIKNPYAMSEIPKRRYEQLYLKLEQLQGNKAAEAKWAGRLVEFVSGWEGQNCQVCHANPKVSGDKVTHFDLDNWWVGERYAALMKENGSAAKTEVEARAALLKNPLDEAAQIRLGYALKAQGRTAESQAALRQIPWSRWSDKPYLKPLRLAQFP